MAECRTCYLWSIMKTNFNDLVPEHVKAFSPYIPSKPDEYLKQMFRIDHFHRLNNNENYLGPVLMAENSIQNLNSIDIPKYPSGDAFSLREKLAEKFSFEKDNFLIGNGSNELITSIVKAFCQNGDNIVAADKTYAVYEWVAEYSGIDVKLAELDDDHQLPVSRMLDAIDSHTKIIFLCNPNNPTGKYWTTEMMRYFLDQVDGRCIVVLDEAYFEFVEKTDFPDGMKLVQDYPNLVVFRTFSKMYGLASLRIGYLFADQRLISIIEKTHIKYSVNHLAQISAWESLNNDHELLSKTREEVQKGKIILKHCFNDLGLNHSGGEGNFWMVELPVSDLLVYKKLMKKGFAIRPMTTFRFPNWIRVSIVEHEVMDKFCKAIKTVL